jgi:hypothetical protein
LFWAAGSIFSFQRLKGRKGSGRGGFLDRRVALDGVANPVWRTRRSYRFGAASSGNGSVLALSVFFRSRRCGWEVGRFMGQLM